MKSLVGALALLASSSHALIVGTAATAIRLRGGAPAADARIAIIVDVEVVPERVDEFLEVMQTDTLGSRTEDGCLRFDLLRDNENPNRFFFYEVYKDGDAVATHKGAPHFKVWSDFKESGGVVKQTSSKASFPSEWGFQ